MILSHLMGRPDVWSRMVAPPVLVSKGNVMIGYSPVYEYSALPDVARIAEAIRRVMGSGAAARTASPDAAPRAKEAAPSEVVIRMPVMGEGIRAARIVSLAKKPGEAVRLDEALCEVETDKAVYPIESSFVGVLKEWRVKPDDLVEIGRDIAVLSVEAAGHPSFQDLHRIPRAADAAPARPAEAKPSGARPAEPLQGTSVEPALSLSITRRLAGVVMANMEIDARWLALRSAREAGRKAGLDHSPSLMIAWCTARAMEKHAAFRRLVQRDGSILENGDFDLGVAVSLEGGRLATAVIRQSNRLDWPGFAAAYAKAVADSRAGRVADVQTPINITSLGAFGIERATPIVVPPSVATLFIGKAHERMANEGGSIFPIEVITLSLTFDHRVVNGAGAAAFLHELKTRIEEFRLPV